jgi:Bacterial aa3 type cytochrome c oxidase subunit IV
MAEQHAVSEGGHPDMDYAEHEGTYRLFVTLLKYSTIGIIVLLIILAVLTL